MPYKYNPFTDNLDQVIDGFSTTKVEFTSQTSVTVVHNNGYHTSPTVVISDDEYVPFNVEQTSVNAFTVTFSSAQTGYLFYGTSGASSGRAAEDNVTSITDTYTTLSTDDTIKVTGSNSFTITIITAVGRSGKKQRIKHFGSGVVTLTVDGGGTIDNESSIVVYPTVSAPYPCLEIQSDNSNWMMI